jgi:hypothetical protein
VHAAPEQRGAKHEMKEQESVTEPAWVEHGDRP